MNSTEREIHGATPMAGRAKDPITLRETDTNVVLYKGFSELLNLSAREARFLARKLNRLALRIERRQSATTPNTEERP